MTKLRATADWTRGDHVNWVRMGEVERPGHIDKTLGLPKRLRKCVYVCVSKKSARGERVINAQAIEYGRGARLDLYASVFDEFESIDPPVYDYAPFVLVWGAFRANDASFFLWTDGFPKFCADGSGTDHGTSGCGARDESVEGYSGRTQSKVVYGIREWSL